MTDIVNIVIYVLFILAINALSVPKRAYIGNIMGICAMLIALAAGLTGLSQTKLLITAGVIGLGALTGGVAAKRIKMADLPQMVALLNGFGGLSAGLIGIAESTVSFRAPLLVLLIIGIGAITFSGSLAAFFKLAGLGRLIDTEMLRTISLIILATGVISGFYAFSGELEYIIGFGLLMCLWGFLFMLPVGGADMPIIISVLNSFSGWCTVLIGFDMNNTLLIIVGTLIGASGTILSYVMTKAMNRNLFKVLFNLKEISGSKDGINIKPVHKGTAADAAFLMENAEKVIIVPGYGMAAANAQYELANMAKILKEKYQVEVKFAIHPVAGRMPGHMNVLLAEADVNQDDVFELKDINQEFQTADVAYVIGANDTTNPLAKTEVGSPIYQMPVLEVEAAKKVLFVKRSLAPGYAGIDNPLFYADNTIMLFGDAKDITKQIVTDLEE